MTWKWGYLRHNIVPYDRRWGTYAWLILGLLLLIAVELGILVVTA